MNTVWASAALRAWTPAPLAAIFAPIVVPMFSPRTIAAAIGNGSQPRYASTIVSTTVTLDDWRINVMTTPMSINISTEPIPCEASPAIEPAI